MLTGTKSAYKYVFEKEYNHHYLFRIEDENSNILYRECFNTKAEAQAVISRGMEIDWGDYSAQVKGLEETNNN